GASARTGVAPRRTCGRPAPRSLRSWVIRLHCRTPSPPYEWSSAQSGVKKLDGEILRPAVSRSLREEPRDQTSRVDGGLGNQVSGGIPGLIRHASRCTRPAV